MTAGATTRDVQLSAFPEMAPNKPVGGLLGSVFVGTNAELMAAVAPYYFTGSVMDVTYGEGKWWSKGTPERFTAHDLYKVDGVDFRALPEADGSIDTVCFDPPYIPQGGVETSTAKEFLDNFGLTSMSRAELWQMMDEGQREAMRVARSFVLMKCNDFTNGGAFHLGHKRAIDTAEAAGWVVHDLIVHHTGAGPGGHNIYDPIRARRHHSYLLAFSRTAVYS